MESKCVIEVKDLLAKGKVLSAAFLAQEAKQAGDNVPSEVLVVYMGKVVKDRASVLDSLPHDTFKCPHSH